MFFFCKWLSAFPLLLCTADCPSFNINYPSMRTLLCPGDTITYTCALNSSNTPVSTQWVLSAQQCPNTANAITLAQAAGASLNQAVVSCGNFSAVMTNVSGTCFTSVLTIPTPQYFNGTTVLCRETNLAPVGSGTLNIQLACKLIFITLPIHIILCMTSGYE